MTRGNSSRGTVLDRRVSNRRDKPREVSANYVKPTVVSTSSISFSMIERARPMMKFGGGDRTLIDEVLISFGII